MPNPAIDADIAQIKANTSVVDSATLFVNGVLARIQAAVDAALAGGATAADLQTVTDQLAIEKTSADALAAAIVANTSAPPTARK